MHCHPRDTCFHALAGPLSTIVPQPTMRLADVAGEEPSIKVNEAVLEYVSIPSVKLQACRDGGTS
jgi:hypothetical protein